jgi:hypothetical protein
MKIDIFETYSKFRNDATFSPHNKQEAEEFHEITMQIGTVNMMEDVITIRESWKDFTKIENLENIIKEFTHHLKMPTFGSVLLRNRRPIPLV